MHCLRSKLFLMIVLISFLFSCKKEGDIFGPKVVINTPVENQSYNVFGFIQVNATVTDQTKITAVSICLTDLQQIPVHTSISIPVTSPSMTINTPYLLNNIHLETGFYYLLITASNGKNISYTYQKVFIVAVPKVRKKIYVLSASDATQTSLSYIDSTFTTIVPFHNFSGDYIGSSASSYFQQGYVCGNYTGNFTGINLATNSLKFSITPITSAAPYFTGYCSSDKNNYIARYDGYIKGYDYSGNIIYNAMAVTGYYAQHFCFNNNYMIAEEKDKTAPDKYLVTYFSTGFGEQQIALTQNVVAFSALDISNVFVFGNDFSGQGVIQLFNQINNNLWNPYPYSLPAGAILSVAQIDAITYLIGHSNGTIYKYNYQIGSLTPYLTGYTAVQLKYDDVNNEVVVVEANRVTTFDYPTQLLHNSVVSAQPVLDVQLLYNR
jgi:hypothetical protein